MTKDKNMPKAMDDTISEAAVGVAPTNHPRVCGAIKRLVSEVEALFPETPVEYSNYDGRNTALDVTFDLSSLDEDAAVDLTTLLGLVEADHRVVEVQVDGTEVLVSMLSSARTQDIRDSFGLAEALHVLADPDDVDEDSGGFLTEFVGTDYLGGSW